ncbi:MAG: glycosyltransferase [Candidatus Faecousia sp.]|nr:glycosyltransferase [Candidatus Faecousia sp.]
MTDLPLISVVVPVYRVEKYLDHCIQSIAAQTYPNLEILLVDDGSPDGSGAICDRWAEKDSRIRVFHKQNAGAGAARNTALDAAAGELIAFVDSDDYLHPNMYAHLYGLMKDGVDIAECVIGLTENDNLPMDDGTGAEILVCDTEEALGLHIQDAMFCQTPPNKLYRRECVGGIRFPEGNLIDDEFFTYKVLGNAKKLAHSSACMYAYRQQSGSAMHKPYSLRRLQGLDAKLQRLAYFEQRFPGLVREAKADLLMTCLGAMQGCLRSLQGEDMETARTKLRGVLAQILPLEIPEGTSAKRKLLMKAAGRNLEQTAKLLNFFIDIGLLK